jgi:glycosyltransferase involved in cell wall biosynthesis
MRKKICFVVAISGTARSFLKDHIAALSKDYDIYLVADDIDEQIAKEFALAGYKKIDIHREITIANDLKAVFALRSYFVKMKFDAVHSVTPKAGLVTALAAKLAGVPNRTHIFTGQVWATATGFKRWLLKSLDKLIAAFDNHILVDGNSQRMYLIQQGVVSEKKSMVFADGSINGVNYKRFVPNEAFRKSEREKMHIAEDNIVYLFMGRLNHDKGIYEMFSAFNKLVVTSPRAYLLFIGDDEEHCMDHISEYSNIIPGKNFCYYGSTKTPEVVLNAGDVFVLPTYREGFGTSVLEAACIGLPSICSDAYGVQDAFVDGETGLRCKVGDAASLYDCMLKYYDHPNMIENMGQASRERALTKYNGDRLTQCWVDFYHKILG